MTKVKTKKTSKKGKIHVRQGDIVQVISGNDKKKVGRVKKVYLKASRIVVENVNIKTKHTKATKEGESGQISQIENPIHSSNVMLYSKQKNITSRYSTFIDEKNIKRKKLKKTGEIITYNDKE
uniref:ribosomal protein L24 n=1 Tax=Gloiopeltis furcata TaxID=42017 RepID=UPI0028D0CF16|nr:ribosomal protein L24 [Gloiopeltis furcata]WMP13933.1 ribosomal protein L24 [Gloiopeltis furcata]